MAIRLPEHPDGFGPVPVSPWTQTWRDWTTTPGTVQEITVTIPYDNTTKALLAPVVTHRDALCKWTQLLINPPSGTLIPVPRRSHLALHRPHPRSLG